MAGQLGKCKSNNVLDLQNAFSVTPANREERKEDDYVDDKVHISKTTITTEVQENLICNKNKRYEMSTILNNIKTELSTPEVQSNMKHGSLKIEEGINMDHIKVEFNNGLLYCEDCQVYRKDYCTECEMLVHILNKTVPVNAVNNLQKELPHKNILEIQDYMGQFWIIALKVIPVGVRFGPFTGLNATERPWKIKGGKFVVNNDESKYLNWMQYINPARTISEQNLCVFQYEHNLYYESTRQIEEGDELLVHFGEEYEDSLDRNIEMDFIPPTKHTFKDAFACTFCCLGFSSKWYLAKHKTVCPGNAAGGFSIEVPELMQCPSCKIHLHQKEYILHHKNYCCRKNDRKCILPTSGKRATQVNCRKTRPRQMHKCQQCKYKTKYIGDFKNHVNTHYKAKMYKCGICSRRFKAKELLQLHVENARICADGQDDLKRSTAVYTNSHVKAKHAHSPDKMKRFKCPLCAFRTKHKLSLKTHMKTKHLEQFKYKCDRCEYKANVKCNLKTHIESKHLEEFKYKCDTCGYKTNLKCNLKIHTETKHLEMFKYTCNTCDYKSNLECNLKIHIETKHLGEFKYKCDTCVYKTNLKCNLKIHVETKHLGEFKYKCVTCDYKTNLECNLKIHIETKHLEAFKYKCNACDYKTNLECNLKIHIESKHLKEFKYKCDTCDYKTNLKCNLQKHVETRHLKEFKYKCDMCDYKGNYRAYLKTHIDTRHLNKFKYKCDRCDYKTNFQHPLKKHIDTKHLKKFKHKCDTCDYKANSKSHLTVHVRSKHLKEFSYKCEICDYKTNIMSDFRSHTRTKRCAKNCKSVVQRLLNCVPQNNS